MACSVHNPPNFLHHFSRLPMWIGRTAPPPPPPPLPPRRPLLWVLLDFARYSNASCTPTSTNHRSLHKWMLGIPKCVLLRAAEPPIQSQHPVGGLLGMVGGGGYCYGLGGGGLPWAWGWGTAKECWGTDVRLAATARACRVLPWGFGGQPWAWGLQPWAWGLQPWAWGVRPWAWGVLPWAWGELP